MASILLLEDDAALVDGLRYALTENGFTLAVARTVAEATALLASHPPFDLMLLDVTLPDGTGFAVCKAVRAAGSRVPVIFLTAADEEYNVIRGLDMGGDDYITKPFKLGELCSRIRALLRRAGTGEAEHTLLESGGLTIDLVRSTASMAGRPLELTAAEYRLLCLLVKSAGQTVTRTAILDSLWDGNGAFVDDNTLSVYIRRLREKLESDPSHPVHLETVRGFGYRWKGVAL